MEISLQEQSFSFSLNKYYTVKKDFDKTYQTSETKTISLKEIVRLS